MAGCGVDSREAAVAEALRAVAWACNSGCLRDACRGIASGAGGPLEALERLASEAARRGCPEERVLREALGRLRALLQRVTG